MKLYVVFNWVKMQNQAMNHVAFALMVWLVRAEEILYISGIMCVYNGWSIGIFADISYMSQIGKI